MGIAYRVTGHSDDEENLVVSRIEWISGGTAHPEHDTMTAYGVCPAPQGSH